MPPGNTKLKRGSRAALSNIEHSRGHGIGNSPYVGRLYGDLGWLTFDGRVIVFDLYLLTFTT